jgi:serine/threonine protein phosphatase PrpC
MPFTDPFVTAIAIADARARTEDRAVVHHHPRGLVVIVADAKQARARLGSGRASPVSFSRPALEGTLVVATDGLFNYASRNGIADAILACGEDVDAAACKLVERVRLPRGSFMDDMAAVVVRRR